MPESIAIVITSISAPNRVLQEIAQGAQQQGNTSFIVIGDAPSPKDFSLEGCQFYGLEQQMDTGLSFAVQCPQRRYSRKNIGYLLAIQQGASIIVETDDDNIPYPTFWNPRQHTFEVPVVEGAGWSNVYRYFSDAPLWPRGLPLDEVHTPLPDWDTLPTKTVHCPIQQGLADDNPDVDAIYRLLFPLPQKFRGDRRVALATHAWCPFNSQNTTWYPEAFPLLYLPTTCSFRMTDIWRSFIAQAIAWVNDWAILFHEPTVWQERNEHDLMKDFKQEVDGYLRNREFCDVMKGLQLAPGGDRIPDNLILCYEKLTSLGFFEEQEISLLHAWLEDLGTA